MSDLVGGRTSNVGPVPVSDAAAGTSAAVRTPRDVMRERYAREARRAETRQAEQTKKEEEAAAARRRSAAARANVLAGGERFSQGSSQYTPDVPQGAFPRPNSGQVAGAQDYGVPTSRTSADPRRNNGSTQAQQAEPRVAPTAGAPRAQSGRPAQRQPSGSQPQAAGSSSQAGAEQSGGRASTFPHAFERWESLSSHWEGLTSYWLRRLETDAEEITKTVPSAAQMSRQINDLSAAGANLFHAVVELQRLRASSERKFQRWFFETRADTERASEVKAQLEQQLLAERAERQRLAKERAEIDLAVQTAQSDVTETRRELMISKEEARRAWEELGRRNQESLELAESLKAGKMTIVSGVQVMPIFGQPSRTASASQRPVTRDGVQYDQPGMSAAAAGLRTPGDEDYYGESPTNTDPFIESRPALHHEPGVASLATGAYQPSYHATAGPSGQYDGSGQAGSAAQQTTPRAKQQQLPTVTADDAEQFYQQGQQNIYSQPPQRQRARLDDLSESSDWDAEGDAQRQRELAEHYGLGGAVHPAALTQIPPEAPSVPATSAAAMATYGPATSQAPTLGAAPDYEGEGYDDWDNLGARSTHHPTRLSDVLEEEEERSSRRTGD